MLVVITNNIMCSGVFISMATFKDTVTLTQEGLKTHTAIDSFLWSFPTLGLSDLKNNLYTCLERRHGIRE